MASRLEWKGAEFRGQVVDAIAAGLTEFGIRHESEAKRQLVPGQGVLTGTLRRSIHAAGPSYNFAADDLPPASGTPERAGTGGEAEEVGGSVVISVGSGMSYARAQDQRARRREEKRAVVVAHRGSLAIGKRFAAWPVSTRREGTTRRAMPQCRTINPDRPVRKAPAPYPHQPWQWDGHLSLEAPRQLEEGEADRRGKPT